MFERDLAANKLPQWMFITPNMSLFSLLPTPPPLFSFSSLARNKTSAQCFGIEVNIFIASDGHDTSVTVAGKWTRALLDPLLTNTNFMSKTLVLVSK